MPNSQMTAFCFAQFDDVFLYCGILGGHGPLPIRLFLLAIYWRPQITESDSPPVEDLLSPP